MKHILTFLSVLITLISQAQLAGTVDTTFLPNQTTYGYYKAVGVEVIENSVYYAYSTPSGQPVIRKYDLEGNEDEIWYNNQMSTWGTQFATVYLEPEKNSDGDYTGEFFVCGRNSSNYLVNQGVRFINKINADGTRDLNFVCPITSWINICSAIYHDWENNVLYYSYQSGYNVNNYNQTIVKCDPNTGQILQTLNIPGINGTVKKITKIHGTNDLIVGGQLNFTYNGNQYNGVFKINEQFNIEPIEGITNLQSNFSVTDILFVDDVDCGGTLTGQIKAYVAGGGSQISGVSGLRSLARYTITNGVWNIDSNYNAGTSGTIGDIVYYNCHLIATGNFSSSMPTGPYSPTWTPKITAFDREGLLSNDFKLINTGFGLGGVYVNGFENSFGQGSGTCLAVNSTDDGNDRWEIFIGGSFVNLISGPQQPNVIKHVNYVAKLNGFRSYINPRFDYCLSESDANHYMVKTSNSQITSGCEKWELFKTNDLSSGWNLIKTDTTHEFIVDRLTDGVWYKLIRTVSECGNTCSSGYVIYRDPQNCQIQNSGTELRLVISVQKDDDVVTLFKNETIDIVVTPNPTTGMITITDNMGNIFRDISLYNSIGVKVLNASSSNDVYTLDLTYLPSGVYMIVVTTSIEVKTKQVVKE